MDKDTQPDFGWHQVCGQALTHFYVDGKPICGTTVLPLHPVNDEHRQCKNCLSRLYTNTVDDKYNFQTPQQRAKWSCEYCKESKKLQYDRDGDSCFIFCTYHQKIVEKGSICDVF